ncbi:unnamed protein product, partial [Mesorhabditis spiculigera]
MIVLDRLVGHRPKRRRRLSTYATFLFIFCQLFSEVSPIEEFRCPKIDIRNQPKRVFDRRGDRVYDFPNLQNCTIIEGSLSITMMPSNTSASDFIVFKNLREITGYLMIFQVGSLRTLSRIFPNLRVIGGNEMIMMYSLIVFQNDDLIEVNLPKLQTIRNGGVRISENPHLCFAQTVDWSYMVTGPVNDILVEDHSSMPTTIKEGEAPCDEFCTIEGDGSQCRKLKNGEISCWNSSTCQMDCPYNRLENGTGPGPGCADGDMAKCHDECIGGCDVGNDATACHACRHVIHNHTCQRQCPDHLYTFLDRRCISYQDCRNITRHKPINGHCQLQCPEGYQEDPKDSHKCEKCKEKCPRKCEGKTVDALSIAMQLHDCSIITGNLEIEMRMGMDSVPPEKLVEAFGKIEIIEGYLIVRFSPTFISLYMFKSLHTIRGKELFRNKYSLIIFDNQNLRQLFAPGQKVLAEDGKFQIQNNRMLCFNRIHDFMKLVGKESEMDIEDQSPETNGERAVCEESSLEVNVTEVLHNGFIIQWAPFNTTDSDHRKFLGYQVFYKKVPKIDYNMSVDDDRSACSDSWMMHFEAEKDDNSKVRGALIASSHINANSIYALYVQTRIVKHAGARNAVSKILFITTKYHHPNEPKFLISKSLSSSEIEIEWSPPTQPNGEITHYIVSWAREVDEVAHEHPCGVDRLRISHAGKGNKPEPPGTTSAISRFMKKDEETCSKTPGCCQCAAVSTPPPTLQAVDRFEDDAEEVSQNAHFEDEIQNVVFVQSATRRKRSITDGEADKDAQIEAKNKTKVKKPMKQDDRKTEKKPNSRANTVTTSSVPAENLGEDYVSKTINVTGTKFIIKNLTHFGNYRISISACQNRSAPENYCTQRPNWRNVRTWPIAENDIVDNKTIGVTLLNGTTNDIKIQWDEPEDPNGAILGYKLRIVDVDTPSQVFDRCINRTFYNTTGGMIFKNLPDGTYEILIQTVTLEGPSALSKYLEKVTVSAPSWFTIQRILIGLLSLIVLIAAGAVIIWLIVKRYYGKQLGEFVRQISANPEYLSQLEVYKQDAWELKREDLKLDEEIGRGTFGKVFRGTGNKIQSLCGIVFGDCAIKTVMETATSSDKLHFLLEASVMKQFNTSFIVKLYGVVSDGQPVLVVMEMMAKGNLRDYLRSRRPDAEENLDGLPVPTEAQYFEWASQIADGMAYLEGLKFCHRDLAARNCMVQADETVKIGDFGMARDVYYHEYYKPTGKRLMPVRWMAPESLKDGKFTLKSDVWSYGIVLYEMLTLAQQPYQGLANDEVFNYIGLSRKTLEKPMDCPDFWYDLMTSCWRYDPRDRPSFHQLVHHLKDFASEDFREKSHVLNHSTIDASREEPPYAPEPRKYRPDGSVMLEMDKLPMDESDDELDMEDDVPLRQHDYITAGPDDDDDSRELPFQVESAPVSRKNRAAKEYPDLNDGRETGSDLDEDQVAGRAVPPIDTSHFTICKNHEFDS